MTDIVDVTLELIRYSSEFAARPEARTKMPTLAGVLTQLKQITQAR